MRKKDVKDLDETALFELSHYSVTDWMTKTFSYNGQPLDKRRIAQIKKKSETSHFLSLLAYQTLKKFNYNTDNREFNHLMQNKIKEILIDFKEKG